MAYPITLTLTLNYTLIYTRAPSLQLWLTGVAYLITPTYTLTDTPYTLPLTLQGSIATADRQG